jgi:hypothetical protein
MNVEIGAEAMQFPEKEYINGIFVAVHALLRLRPNQPQSTKPIWLRRLIQSSKLFKTAASGRAQRYKEY